MGVASHRTTRPVLARLQNGRKTPESVTEIAMF